jgi:hypothetical protein
MPRVCLSLLLVTLLLSTPWTQAQPTYTVETVDLMFEGATATTVTGINPWRQMVGLYQDAHGVTHGFLCWGPFEKILPQVLPTGINRHGTLTGWQTDSVGEVVGFLWDRERFLELRFPDDGSGQFRPARVTEPLGLNDDEVVVGSYLDHQARGHGFLYRAGVFTRIDAPFDTTGLVLTGINNAGTMTGLYFDARRVAHGLLIDASGFHTVDVPGVFDTQWQGINHATEKASSTCTTIQTPVCWSPSAKRDMFCVCVTMTTSIWCRSRYCCAAEIPPWASM